MIERKKIQRHQYARQYRKKLKVMLFTILSFRVIQNFTWMLVCGTERVLTHIGRLFYSRNDDVVNCCTLQAELVVKYLKESDLVCETVTRPYCSIRLLYSYKQFVFLLMLIFALTSYLNNEKENLQNSTLSYATNGWVYEQRFFYLFNFLMSSV